MGLQLGINDVITNPGGSNGVNVVGLQATAVELFDIPIENGVIQKITGRTKADVMLPQSCDDQLYIAKCLEKHGENYLKMYRDIKINKMQYTERQLEKMGEVYFGMDEKERVGNIGPKLVKLLEDRV